MEIKNILFPTDFSEGSSQALPYAVDLTKRYGAKLYLLHVIYDVVKGGGWYVPYPAMEEMYKKFEEDAKKEIDKFAVEELSAIKVKERHVIIGVPYEEIINFAKKNNIDVIIMGSHGRKGLNRVLLGSTASQVIRYAPCPVLTVRIPYICTLQEG
jgi:nucleotide-binding universal stress UspA family protein